MANVVWQPGGHAGHKFCALFLQGRPWGSCIYLEPFLFLAMGVIFGGFG